MISFEKRVGRIGVELSALPMGEDWTVAITGGVSPHLGAAALGIPRPSLENPEKTSASVSVLTVTGHRDDEIARLAAHRLASRLGRKVLVACGIHIDGITRGELSLVGEIIEDLLARFLSAAEGKG